MQTLIFTLLPLVITGLAFLSYKHPSIARQILSPLHYIVVGIFILLTAYNSVMSNAYFKAQLATRTDIFKRSHIDLDIDSLYKVVNDRDSINLILLNERCQREKEHEVKKYLNILQDSISNNIEAFKKETNDTYDSANLYLIVAFLIIITLHGLSFLFDKLHLKQRSDTEEPKNDQK